MTKLIALLAFAFAVPAAATEIERIDVTGVTLLGRPEVESSLEISVV